MEKIYTKLVRDRIPEIITADDEVPVTRILSDKEYKIELENKLLEECNEVINSKTDLERLQELGDVLEVMCALATLGNNTMEDIMQVRLTKRQKRGGFENRIFLEKAISKER